MPTTTTSQAGASSMGTAGEHITGGRRVGSGAVGLLNKRLRALLDRQAMPYVKLVKDCVIDEARPIREEATAAREAAELARQSVIDEAKPIRQSIIDESKAIRDEATAAREAAELARNSVMDEARAIKEEARAQRGAEEGELASLHDEVAELGSAIVELTRMLRMQGDAADEVAEMLGRAFTRLSAELETLSSAVQALDRRLVEMPARA